MSHFTEDGSPARPSLSETSPARSEARKRAWAGRVLREPLVHFVVLGVVIFGGYRLLDHQTPVADATTSQIVITNDDLRQLAVVWLAQGREKPTPAQLQALIEQKAMSEMLVREAIALGLDRDDEVIKRRLAQKMDFLLADIAALAPPTNVELAIWFAAHKAEFTKPPRIRFRHLYFNSDKRAGGAREAAEASLPLVAGRSPGSLGAAGIGDPFMFRDYYADITPEQMAKEFGGAFANALFALRPGDWRGPIESGYGWHLIWVESYEEPRVPALEEVRPIVVQAWQAEKYREVKQRAMDEIRSRYRIVAPSLDDLNVDDLTIVSSGPSRPVAE
ncbi:peptidylprolyl isomerase [Chelatococcus sp.]|uniref:peptidylprolyl isomerase n=1 Tax=Chelatococcus sp. TaxID=1953771 RepID=UPI0025B8896F|nr:peptidylprolyl isomerase [Chelatococcus sp.]